MGKSTKPSGLGVTRSGLSFTWTWTTHDYTDQDSRCTRNEPPPGQNAEIAPGDSVVKKNTKKYTHALNWSDYKPSGSKTLSSISFKVRGKQKNKSESSYVSKTYNVYICGVPQYGRPSIDNSNPNVCTFSWARNGGDGDNHIFVNYQYQTILIASSELDGSKLSSSEWSKASTQKISILNRSSGVRYDNQPSINNTTDTGLTIVEPSSTINDGLTRFFRVRAQGPAGESDWCYSSHKFGAPPQANVDTNDSAITHSDSEGVELDLNIELPSGLAYDGDQVEYRYAITTPASSDSTVSDPDGTQWKHVDLSLPAGFNSWTTWRAYRAVQKNEETPHLSIPTPILEDQMLFVQINTKHDSEITYGQATLIKNYTGKLKAPVITNVTDPDPTTKLVTVTVSSSYISAVAKAFIAVYCRTQSDMNPSQPIAIIPFGQTSVTFKTNLGDESASFGVQAFVADYSPISALQNEVTKYSIRNIQMQSDNINWDSSSVSLPQPPSEVKLSRKKEGTIQVNWKWTWTEADAAEISWSSDPDAWVSNNAPQTYIVTNTNSGQFYISGLSAGKYYVRVRLIKNTDESSIYGTYSGTEEINISSAPNSKNLMLSESTGPVDGEITATWDYESTDGTAQSYAELAEAVWDSSNSQWNYTPLPNANTNTAKHITFKPSDFGWAENTEHFIALSTSSQSGMTQDWSDPVRFNVVTKPVPVVTGIGGSTDPIRLTTIPIDDESSLELPTLVKLPLTFTVSGAGIGGTTSAALVRYADFDQERPDNSDLIGYEGETVARQSIQNAGESVTFSWSHGDGNIVGLLDDEAKYRLIVTVKDSYGQVASVEPLKELYGIEKAYCEVHWDTQAVMPLARVSYDHQYNVGFITIDEPAGHEDGGYCEIYRLSVDNPELIISNAEIGQTYVDPFPTIGAHGGYRIVYKSKYGDYKTSDGQLSWVDFTNRGNQDGEFYLENGHVYIEGDSEDLSYYDDFEFSINQSNHLIAESDNGFRQNFWLSDGHLFVDDLGIGDIDEFAIMIDFDGDRLILPGNIKLNNSWKKDFQLTRYLGGSIEGDWNSGVERSGTYNADIPVELDRDTIEGLRLLANYPGVCHVRTPDGSNFYANIDVSEDRQDKFINAKAGTSLTITRCNRVEEDGIMLEEWIRRIS